MSYVRRLKRVEVDLQIFMSQMIQGNKLAFQCIEGVPEGSEFHGSGFDYAKYLAVIVIHHPSFEEVPEGCEIPIFVPKFELLTKYDRADESNKPV